MYSEGVFKLGVDDPLDAFAVHFGGGFWGIIAVCLFANDSGILYAWNGDAFAQLLWNLIGGLVSSRVSFSLKNSWCSDNPEGWSERYSKFERFLFDF